MFSNLDVSSPKAKEDGYASALREQHSNGVKAVFSNNMDFAYVDFVNREVPATYPTFRSVAGSSLLSKSMCAKSGCLKKCTFTPLEKAYS